MSEGTAEMRAALALSRVADLGPARIRRAIDAHGSAREALQAFRGGEFRALTESEARLESGRKPPRPSDEVLGRLRDVEPAAPSEIAAWWKRGIRLLPYGAAGYPPSLLDLHDPPTLLYLQGEGPLPGARAVTIVGARQATDYGRRMARDLATDFARRGWTVVSGLARGIDAEAHRATLEAGGATVGVLAGGLAVGGGRLREAVRTCGLLMSEIEPELRPDDWAFPRRNRILSALGRGVIVVQAGPRSGTSITVGHALDIGREVFAVPGPVGPAVSAGVHALVRDGARLITCVEDVLEDLGEDVASVPDHVDSPSLRGLPRPRKASRAILRRAGSGPADAGELVRASGLSSPDALALLSRLELAGWLRRLEDGRYGGARSACTFASTVSRARAVSRSRVGATATGRDGTEPPILA